MSNEPEVILNEAEQRFELHIDGHMAYEVFERFPGGIAYLHTIVPKELEGRGVASRLVRHILDYAARAGLKVRPDCPFVTRLHRQTPRIPGQFALPRRQGRLSRGQTDPRPAGRMRCDPLCIPRSPSRVSAPSRTLQPGACLAP